MLDNPQVVDAPKLLTAAIRFTVPRAEMAKVMGPAIGELMAALAAQGLAPAGPVFSYHFRMDPAVFDFEVGFPVKTAVKPTGRVKPSTLRAARVARARHRGAYEGLGQAWGELDAWIAAQKLKPAVDLWEFYSAGPESSPNPANWLTEMNRPLEA